VRVDTSLSTRMPTRLNPHRNVASRQNLKTEAMMNYYSILPRSYFPSLFSEGFPLINASSHIPLAALRVHRAASTRSAGRQFSTRSRLHSTSSMIVHSDTEEDEDHHAAKPNPKPYRPQPRPMTRTRKARMPSYDWVLGVLPRPKDEVLV